MQKERNVLAKRVEGPFTVDSILHGHKWLSDKVVVYIALVILQAGAVRGAGEVRA